MSQQTTNVFVTNNMGGDAVLILYHQYTGEAIQVGGPWTVADGQNAGPLAVTFWTWSPGLDWWSLTVGVLNGPNAGTWSAYSPITGSAQTDCTLDSDDEGSLTFWVSPETFFINSNSSPQGVASMRLLGPYYPKINNIFVLMLENRSFDHMLGFSGITGTDPATGNSTSIIGLSGTESNSYNGVTYTVATGAPLEMSVDPGHEFQDTLEQLCGSGAVYTSGGTYPAVNNSGFVYDFNTTDSEYEGHPPAGDEGQVMLGYDPTAIPVLSTLAKTYAVCDQWFASMPGPTWPNRFFAYAATSGGLDDSPSSSQILGWEFGDGLGVDFANGSLFDRFGPSGTPNGFALFNVDESTELEGSVPIVASLKNIYVGDSNSFSDFGEMLNSPYYNYRYTFIEPNYGDVSDNTYQGGCSQHPMDNVLSGEAMIAATYEAIRNSPLWGTSLLIVTYDEHGGFYDHVAPGPAIPPGDAPATPDVYNTHGFNFSQYGVRVPAVVISPWIPSNTVDHTVYDHSSIAATVTSLFDMPSLTNRDAAANSLTHLLSLTESRTDCPLQIEGVPALSGFLARNKPEDPAKLAEPLPEKGNLHGFLYAAVKSHLELDGPETAPAIIAEYKSIQTRGQAKDYLQKVGMKIKARREVKRAARHKNMSKE